MGIKQKTTSVLRIDFVRFGLVGAVGFFVSMALLYLFHGQLGLPTSAAFLLSNEGALLSNFMFHEHWTYKHLNHGKKPLNQKLLHFHLSSWSGVAIIMGIGLFSVKVLDTTPYVGQAFGSAVAMFWNFFWTRYFIFRGKTPAVLSHPEDAVELDEE